VFDPTYNYSQDVDVRPSTIQGAGKGAFAKVLFRKNQVIGQYTGRVVSQKQLAKMTKQQINKIISFVDASNREQLIDGAASQHFTVYVNHKWRKTGNPVGAANVITTGSGHFGCLRDIEPDEELFMDYGIKYWAYQLFEKDVDEVPDTAEQLQLMKEVMEKLPN
jgi:SET domain-containing protein